jgi:Fic family protein
MDFGTMMKYILIAALILAGYYVVSQTAAIKRREGFESSTETPAVAAKQLSELLTDKTKSMVGFLQVSDNKTKYENLNELMEAWTHAKIVASLNALSEQMIGDSTDQSAMTSPPSDKTVALMNSLITMTNFQSTVVPAVFKIVANS